VAGVCTGAFLLGDAGLLDGHACTTHHEHVAQLRRRHPAAQVLENRLCGLDGRLWTSAGVAAGIDLALQLVAQRFGEHVALRVARENVVPLRRFSGDPALSLRFRWREHGNQLVHAMQDEIANDLSHPWTGEALARKAGFSTRHLARLFKTETGVTMKRYQTELRMDLARRLVQGSTLSLEHVAERCGFGSMQAFRATWNKFEGEPPSRRRRLAAREDGED
jgi:transcriptional regulator GlxA family with amidase domain